MHLFAKIEVWTKMGFMGARVRFCVIFWLDLELFMLDIDIRNIWEHGFGLIDEKLIDFIYGFISSENINK